MFDIDDTWIYGKNKQYIDRQDEKNSKNIEVISGITVNNGVNYYTSDVLTRDEVFEDMLTISTRGEYSGTVTYHKEKFALANNILTMPMPKWSRNSKMFIATIISNIGYGGYSGYPRKETLKNDVISLPIKNDNIIDFDFMDTFISELEAYLLATGLKDYKLNKDELYAVERIHKNEIKWKEVRIVDRFSVKNTSNILSEEISENSGDIPYLGATSQNNGILSYISYDEKYKDDGECVFIGGKTFVVTYQENDFYSNDSHNLVLYYNDIVQKNKLNNLFFCTSIKKALRHKYSWGNSISKSKIQSDYMMLPVDDKDDIDYDFMKNIISAVQKLVIKDVVLYSDKKIKVTKQVVNNSYKGKKLTKDTIFNKKMAAHIDVGRVIDKLNNS